MHYNWRKIKENSRTLNNILYQKKIKLFLDALFLPVKKENKNIGQ